MPNINQWMEKFKENWITKDIDGVLELFTDDINYYETPSRKLEDKEALRRKWRLVRNQEEVELDFEIYSQDESKFTVKWDLKYRESMEQNQLKGIYLIELNEENKCTEFW